MWYTVNASGDEFVRMRIRCHEHPVRACDALTCTSPGGFSVPTRELQTLNSVPEYIFKHLLYGFRLVILLISYLLKIYEKNKTHCKKRSTVRLLFFIRLFQIKNPHQRLQKCLGTARFIETLSVA